MTELQPEIRNTARALIVRQERVLLLRKFSEERGEYFALPGGGQETGETLEQTIARECREEIGTEVALRDLIWVADYFRCRSTQRHLIEMVFLCEVPEHYSPHNGHHPDKHQQEVVWLHRDELASHRLSEPYLAEAVAEILRPDSQSPDPTPTYLGAFHDDPVT
ncbi:NUDIX domain-containing protein [Marinobacter sp. CA1]|uniref:NUDIX domain-containing protein n=1 Tax=Marinobacter sp. CA1 TaxID=2817656 RepID=UPI001D07BE4A|nr:NUDIX domain-containing protein [Marinobacter sp. CA1]MCG8517680.1 NUDIX domain-containing protein [Pseudomonadales bacterium]UDL05484.1 NUDIX domain-containing protein [Marinobacter sp. CA1]